MGKDLNVCLLLDYYGELLTQTQRDLADLYYNEDLTLSEIARNSNITRQGVYDSVKRTEEILENYEKNLKLIEDSKKITELAKEITILSKKLEMIASDEAKEIGKELKKISVKLINTEE